MCEPATLATASLVATGLSTAVGVYSAVQQGQAQKDAANYQAAVARNKRLLTISTARRVRSQD